MLKKKVTDFVEMWGDTMSLTVILYVLMWLISIPFITIVKVIWKGGKN